MKPFGNINGDSYSKSVPSIPSATNKNYKPGFGED